MSVREADVGPQSAVPVRPAILIVEDELILAMDLQHTLIELGYDAYAIAASAETAVQRAQERRPDLVMMDIRIKGALDGIQTARVLKTRYSSAIIYLTAHADEAMIERAKETEPHGYLLKPVGVVELRTTVEIALYKHRLEQAGKLHEESLRRTTQEAQRANGAKSLFLANMSHEIRTPMNAVLGLTYLLEQTSLNPEQTGFVAQINVASKSLLAVLTDVLDLSKIEAGELIISRVLFDPRDLLKGLLAVMRVQADMKGITLQLDMADDLPGAVEGDAARLNQILANLLSNAIKFTECGGVIVEVRRLASTPTGSTLSFAVRDTGIGIDPAAQARLFTPFIQADESITRRYGGTGLGLSIIHSLVKLMGGTVDFTSTVGVGSEFRVVMEFALGTAESLLAAQPPPVSREGHTLSGVHVLVVDDYALNLVVTQRILEQAGARVWVANNGQAAVAQLQRRPEHFDVVLMDVQMPIMDGYEAARRIRADLGLVDLPIIALTAGALLSERQRATSAGMDDFIIKPFDATTLIATVMRHAVRARHAAAEIPTALRAPQESALWPEIEGIDIPSARGRWCDDLALFRSMLERFLEDFADISIPSTANCRLDAQAARLHTLRGGASMLGAHTVQHLAAEAEAACVAHDAAGAGKTSAELATQINALRSSAAAAFRGDRAGAWLTAAPVAVSLERPA